MNLMFDKSETNSNFKWKLVSMRLGNKYSQSPLLSMGKYKNDLTVFKKRKEPN